MHLVRNGSLQPICKLMKFCSTSVLNVIHPADNTEGWQVCSQLNAIVSTKQINQYLRLLITPHFRETHVGNTFYGKKNNEREFSERPPTILTLPSVTRIKIERRQTVQNDPEEKKIDIFQQLSTASNTSLAWGNRKA